LTATTAALASVALGPEAIGAPPPTKALEDPDLLQGMVTFKSGTETLQGYQARPKRVGRYPAVLVLHGQFGVPEADRYTAAQLAQAGFVGLTVKRFSRYPELTVEDVIRSDQTDRRYLTRKFNEEELRDAQAAIDTLQSQPFVRRGGVGLVGFCGGGGQGLWLSTVSKDLRAVVAFYAPPAVSPSTERYVAPDDPKPSLMGMVKQIKVPVQGHYGTADPLTPAEDVRRFERALKAEGTPVEIFFYEGAQHGFCSYTQGHYHAAAATLAKSRMLQFLQRHLK
jgi:carboxymethylenebutenolidase